MFLNTIYGTIIVKNSYNMRKLGTPVGGYPNAYRT